MRMQTHNQTRTYASTLTCTHMHTPRDTCANTPTHMHTRARAHTQIERDGIPTRPGGGHALAHALFDSWEANIPSLYLQVYHLLSVHNRASTNANLG